MLGMNGFRSAVVALAIGAGLGNCPALAANDYDPWPDIKAALFADRPIEDGAGIIRLEAPKRAQDAAVVPITVAAEFPQTAPRNIKSIHLIIDQNPAPVAAVFHFTLDSGYAAISTRVRVDQYTNIRAIAETNDGALYMATRFVKAAGGCSSPALKDADKAMANLGKMKIKEITEGVAPGLRQAQLLISHPNYSGLQYDQINRYYIPAHFVQQIEIRSGDRLVLTVEGNISLSEDPSIHFHYVPKEPGAIAVDALDSDGLAFSQTWPVTPDPGS